MTRPSSARQTIQAIAAPEIESATMAALIVARPCCLARATRSPRSLRRKVWKADRKWSPKLNMRSSPANPLKLSIQS